MMEKKVTLTVMPGSFEQGLPVLLRIKSNAEPLQEFGKLPKTQTIVKLFNQWQSDYRDLIKTNFRIKSLQNHLTHLSYRQIGDDLSQGINDWLNMPDQHWQGIRDALVKNLNKADDILVVIETENLLIRQLPWHLWDLFVECTSVEVTLSLPNYQISKKPAIPLNEQVKILAILGKSKDLDLEADQAILNQLPKARTTFLVNPQKEEINNQLWDHQWHILFFAGHSFSQADGTSGQIYINQNSSLSLGELKNGLRAAIEKGLQLAIFNSCDGLGLARELASLHIPLIIIMREPVPDLVAQEFLKHFLKAFSQGKSLYLAVREARARLQGLELEYPCASWLPVICHNPDIQAPTWSELCGNVNRVSTPVNTQPQKRKMLPTQRLLQAVFLISALATTSLVVGTRYLGWLQPWELWAFDQLQRRRPEEAQDQRILVVGITDDDLKLLEEQEQTKKGSLSDSALALLLKKLEQNKVRAIGLDIYHDFRTRNIPIVIGQKLGRAQTISLSEFMRQDNKLFAICKASDAEASNSGIFPPVEIPSKRLAFSDIHTDPNDILRRYLLEMKPRAGSPCNAKLSLSLKLALYYLETLKSPIHYKLNDLKELEIGGVPLKRLLPHTGVYHTVDTWGYQTLLNYRSYHQSPLTAVAQVSLTQMLSREVGFDDIRGKIVLIGVTSPNARDYTGTPYSSGEDDSKKMPGVVAQAQMISQILSAVLDARPLLWFWPAWGDILWISVWSLWGGLLGWKLRQPLVLILLLTVSGGVLCASCFHFLSSDGYWVPLVPSALVLIVTSSTMILLRVSSF